MIIEYFNRRVLNKQAESFFYLVLDLFWCFLMLFFEYGRIFNIHLSNHLKESCRLVKLGETLPCLYSSSDACRDSIIYTEGSSPIPTDKRLVRINCFSNAFITQLKESPSSSAVCCA